MKFNGENYAGTLICNLIKEKFSEVSLSEIQEAANTFLAQELMLRDPRAKLSVSEKDVKAVCRRKSKVLKYDKKAKKVIILENTVDAYYHLHWGYEAMSSRLYGEDFSERVLESFYDSNN